MNVLIFNQMAITDGEDRGQKSMPQIRRLLVKIMGRSVVGNRGCIVCLKTCRLAAGYGNIQCSIFAIYLFKTGSIYISV